MMGLVLHPAILAPDFAEITERAYTSRKGAAELCD
jgi:hypothetical protein